jgi:hypothetical protein
MRLRIVGIALALAILAIPAFISPQPAPSSAAPIQDVEWDTTSLTGVPSGRYGHTAIWTGSEMIVWGGYYAIDHFLQDGHKYNPVADTWSAISTSNAPVGRMKHTAVWTGQKMIVWGGESGGGSATTNTGGIYDPLTNSWTATSTTNAPSAREHHSAVWTGQEMIVWGGCSSDSCVQVLNNGGRYSPATNTRPRSPQPQVSQRDIIIRQSGPETA